MTKLLFQGHGSLRIISENNTVIYVDPYAGEGYDIPADIILVTHQHGDHNQVQLVAKKDDCVIIQNYDGLIEGKYQSFTLKGIKIEAVPAYNKNHDRNQCVGYIIEVEGIKIYAAGDTSMTKEMALLKEKNLDFAFLPIDGVYNMGPEEATECAKIINAKITIPIHMKPRALFDEEMAQRFTAPNRLIVKAGEEIDLHEVLKSHA